MENTIIFATNNPNKVKEINSVLKGKINIISLSEAGINIDIPEPFDTLEANATEKARVIYDLMGKNCFSEDSGLEVDALDGRPGVHSARYAGDHGDASANMEKLLSDMAVHENRRAQFHTVICLVMDGQYHFFEGTCKGAITDSKRGESGFGYDPIFIPDGADKTFGEMDLDEKNKYSHRKKAVMKLVEFLNESHGKDQA